MPAFVKTPEDERLWAKAKSLAEEQGQKENWAYVTGIFRKMKGGKVADLLPGGLAKGKSPSDFDPKTLAKGVKVEMEHTGDKALAQEIAMDHLTEDPQYYNKLEKMEKKAAKGLYSNQEAYKEFLTFFTQEEAPYFYSELSQLEGRHVTDKRLKQSGNAVTYTGVWNFSGPDLSISKRSTAAFQKLKQFPGSEKFMLKAFITAVERRKKSFFVALQQEVLQKREWFIRAYGIDEDDYLNMTIQLDDFELLPRQASIDVAYGSVIIYLPYSVRGMLQATTLPELNEAPFSAMSKSEQQYWLERYVDWAELRIEASADGERSRAQAQAWLKQKVQSIYKEWLKQTPEQQAATLRELGWSRNKTGSTKQASSFRLASLLCLLRAMHWLHWTNHWTVEGDSFYGDHLLFQRLYEAMPEEIDGLAEKIVATYGAGAVNPVAQAETMAGILRRWEMTQDIRTKALVAERDLQQAVGAIKTSLSATGELSTGLENYLDGLLDAHETNLYLLGQRGKGSKMASQLAARYLKTTRRA
jgi:DNA-binding ferritin-like protein